jgi:hypothetical protein
VGQAGANASIDTGCPLVRGGICDAARHVADAYRAAGFSARAAEALRSAASTFQCPAM